MGRSINNLIINSNRHKGCGSDKFDIPGVPMNTDRIVYLSGEIDERTIAAVTAQFYALVGMDSQKPIYFVISTYGGAIDEMFGLYDTMKFLPCPVYTIGLGKIMSAGVLLLASGEKGHRQIGENSRVMIHPVRGGVSGNIFEICNEVDEIKRLQRRMSDLLLKNSKMKKDQLEKFMTSGHDCFITPQEAITLGLVDKIMSSNK